MNWYQDYSFVLKLFEMGKGVDETTFYFRSDPEETVHYLGYLPQYEKPYWAGYCDVPDGCEFFSAKELFEAKIYDGKSLKDRWNDAVLIELGAIPVEELQFNDYKKGSGRMV